jgi:sialic acid synthase SpsE
MADTYIVAEIGTAHGGDASRADELIRAARESGADCAKFQYVIADEIVHPATGEVSLPGGPTPLYERFRALEQPMSFYEQLMRSCREAGIDFLCTPFGIESARSLRSLGPQAMKVASPELNHTALLDELAGYQLPLFMSSGVSLLADIEYALSRTGRSSVTLLHCVTAYPAPEEEYNLRLIPALRRILGIPIGISDHSEDPTLVPGLGVAMGATVVEKHFTMSRDGSGLDDRTAMDPVLFTRMAATIRRVDAILSLDPLDGGQRIIKEFQAEYGLERVTKVLGDGVKRLSSREERSYRTTRRSLLSLRDLPAGHVLEAHDFAALRSETLTPGLEPMHAPVITGARLQRAMTSGEAITWNHVVAR